MDAQAQDRVAARAGRFLGRQIAARVVVVIDATLSAVEVWWRKGRTKVAAEAQPATFHHPFAGAGLLCWRHGAGPES
jgi:hypothetical protein